MMLSLYERTNLNPVDLSAGKIIDFAGGEELVMTKSLNSSDSWTKALYKILVQEE